MKKDFAFTLAEVLITLGIIGVVAAMTIPTLIQDYNTRVWNTGATVFERKLEEALKTMNTQSTLAGHTTTESFVEELSKHFKTNKICQNDELLDCFSEIVYWGGGEATPEEVDMSKIKTAKNFGQDDWGTNIVGVQFASGVSAMIAYNPTSSCTQDPYSNRVTGGDCLAILYDTSGAKNPNSSGKDLRANGNVLSLGGVDCVFEAGGTCYTTTLFNMEAITVEECEALKDELGIKKCYSDGLDYWAGAVKACGGVNKLPSSAQLLELAKYLYNTTSISDDNYGKISIDTTKAETLSITGEYTRIWSSEEDAEGYVYNRTFGNNHTGYGTDYLDRSYDSGSKVICVD